MAMSTIDQNGWLIHEKNEHALYAHMYINACILPSIHTLQREREREREREKEIHYIHKYIINICIYTCMNECIHTYFREREREILYIHTCIHICMPYIPTLQRERERSMNASVAHIDCFITI